MKAKRQERRLKVGEVLKRGGQRGARGLRVERRLEVGRGEQRDRLDRRDGGESAQAGG